MGRRVGGKSVTGRCVAAVLAAGISLAACSTATNGSATVDAFGQEGAVASDAEPHQRRPDEIAADEIRERGGIELTAYQLVERLRPAWLRQRGQRSILSSDASRLVIYIDGVRSGGPETLRSITAGQVRTMRYTGASEATTRWGTGHSGGVISVATGRAG